MTITVDLPGIGQGGVKYIESPSNSTVQAAIDSALEYWNANAYQEGYVNASSSSYRVNTSYSSQQLALDVGLNASWATGDVSAQFSYTSNENKKVVMAVYKQAFYSIDMDTPENPASIFEKSVSLNDIQNTLDATAPPAYVASVVYGRIIMFRMETSMRVTSSELESAFRYAAGYSVDGTLEARYKSILQQSTVEVVTLGGNAEVASNAVSAKSAGDLEPIIKGENAVYSRNNPGVPISYTIRYLKDHSLAKLGYTTEYTATECSAVKTADVVKIIFKQFKAIKDCDGVGEGDFEIWADISATKESGDDYHKSSIKLGNGDYININNEYSFTANRVENNYFTITFRCKEWDQNILGNTFGDDRMNKKSGSITHKFSNGSWTNLGNGERTIVLNDGNSACSTQFTYSVSIQ
jgi:thiol-activated cytolysin